MREPAPIELTDEQAHLLAGKVVVGCQKVLFANRFAAGAHARTWVEIDGHRFLLDVCQIAVPRGTIADSDGDDGA